MTIVAVLKACGKFVRHQWAIVLIAVLAAAATGYLVAGDLPDKYTAESTVIIDSSALRRFSGLTGPEVLIASVTGREFIDAAAKRVGLPADELRGNLHVYIKGVPVAMYVRYTGADAGEAGRVSSEIAAFVVEWQERLSALEMDRQRTLVEEARHTLDALEDVPLVTVAEDANLEFLRWNVRRDLVTNEATLRSMERVYAVSGEPELVFISGEGERLKAALGAGIVGLFLGIMIGVVRERRTLAST